jgi:hypothetical protein
MKEVMKKRYRFNQKPTKSALQTGKFFEEFIRKEKVVEFIKEYRKILGLPEKGLPLTERDVKEFNDYMIPAFFLPKKLNPFLKKLPKGEAIRILNTCKAFVGQEMGVESIYVEMMLRNFLVFNEVIKIPQEVFYLHSQDDLLRIENFADEVSCFSDKSKFMLEFMYEQYKSVGKKFPIAIFINPEATQNQVKDFISKNWERIESQKNKSKSRLSGIRTKRRQALNDFIYNNKNLPLSEIFNKLSNEKGVILDYGHIGKIIQLEKKKRN